MSLVTQDKFAEYITELAQERVDDKYAMMQLDTAMKDYQRAMKLQRQTEAEIDALDVFDVHYDRKYDVLSRRLEKTFDLLDDSQKRKADAEALLDSIRQQSLTMESVYEALRFFSTYYDRMTDFEKKTFMQSFIDKIELYPEKSRKNGVSIKSIHFQFPVSYEGKPVYNIDFSRPKENTVETVVLMLK